MIEIKFRAWDTETKEMSYDFLNKHWLRVCIESPYVELMQYTGLKDKNGKEAHHKDIVEFEGSKYVIEWCDIDTGFYLAHHECREELDSEYHLLGKCIRESEIIGNEFENPELLEV